LQRDSRARQASTASLTGSILAAFGRSGCLTCFPGGGLCSRSFPSLIPRAHFPPTFFCSLLCCLPRTFRWRGVLELFPSFSFPFPSCCCCFLLSKNICLFIESIPPPHPRPKLWPSLLSDFAGSQNDLAIAPGWSVISLPFSADQISL